jgi:hypothetical protein
LSPLVILIPEDLCDTPTKRKILKDATPGSLITVSVIGKKFEQNDKKITVIASIEEEVGVEEEKEEDDFVIEDDDDVDDDDV